MLQKSSALTTRISRGAFGQHPFPLLSFYNSRKVILNCELGVPENPVPWRHSLSVTAFPVGVVRLSPECKIMNRPYRYSIENPDPAEIPAGELCHSGTTRIVNKHYPDLMLKKTAGRPYAMRQRDSLI